MEQRQRQLLVPALNKLKLNAFSVENPALPGTPDVAYAHGWAELKYADKWPAYTDTALRLPHFTTQQRVCLRRGWLCTQNWWLCLQVSKPRDWLVFDGGTASQCVGKDGYNKERLMEIARLVAKSVGAVAQFLKDQNDFLRLP